VKVVLFRPAYFDHILSIQMTGGSRTLLFGECDPVTLKPSIKWLRQALLGQQKNFQGQGQEAAEGKIKMVAIINPNNPTGSY
jgi:aspartate/methionine/tyrosine aminotransferase